MSISINKNMNEGNFIDAEKSANNTRDKKRTRKKRDGVDGLESSTKEKDEVAEERDGTSGDPKKREKKQEREDNVTEAEKGANNTNDKKRKRKKRYDAIGLESSLKGNDKIAEEKEGLSGDPKKRKKKQEREDNSPEAEKGANNTNDKRKKRKKSDEANCLESLPKGNDKVAEKKEGLSGDPKTSRPKKKARRVSFSGNVEVFPPTEDIDLEKYVDEGLIHGKWFSLEEDELLKKAVFNYLKENQLGDDGLHMVLNCSKHPQVRTCWKQIRSSLPWRPLEAVYHRAHTLFERSEKREWKPEEYIILRSLYEKHGARWKAMSMVLGKHRSHVKDAWRRIALPNLRKGHWSQDEYQTLFDLVNLDLKMKAFEEKETKHGMLRDNIAWGAVSMKLSTRLMSECCNKWYLQLCSPMVSQGLWMNSDDNRMLDALFKLDACCVEDVDWDNLLEHRLGETCRLRWKEMTRQLGEYREKPFVEQLDMLSKRYQPEMLQYREMYEK